MKIKTGSNPESGAQFPHSGYYLSFSLIDDILYRGYCMEELKCVVSAPFKKNLVSSLSIKDFEFSLAFDLKWFSPKVASLVKDQALATGLLSLQAELLVPAFDVEGVRLPHAFKPTDGFVESLNRPAPLPKTAPAGELSFENIINFIAGSADLSKQAVVSEINSMHDRLSYLVDIRIVAIIVAGKFGCSVDDLCDKVSVEVFGTSALV